MWENSSNDAKFGKDGELWLWAKCHILEQAFLADNGR